MEQTKTMDGRVIAVRGAVVDVAFDGGVTLPPIDDALVIMPDDGAPITCEVQAHLNESTVRGIALQSTMGLSRGVPARATGGPIEVTVGESVLGRLLDVTGAVGDKGAAFPADAPRRPIDAQLREAVVTRLAWLGARLDRDANERHGPRISSQDSKISVWVIPTNEELMIARHTAAIVSATVQ